MERLEHSNIGSADARSKHGFNDKTVMIMCPECNKIIDVTQERIHYNRRDSHHGHLERCNAQYFIMKNVEFFAICPYKSDGKLWLWKI